MQNNQRCMLLATKQAISIKLSTAVCHFHVTLILTLQTFIWFVHLVQSSKSHGWPVARGGQRLGLPVTVTSRLTEHSVTTLQQFVLLVCVVRVGVKLNDTHNCDSSVAWRAFRLSQFLTAFT